MADFDDPLDDILSDGSNDSFFEDPKVLAKRNSLDKSKKLTSIFNQPKETTKLKSSDDWLGLDLSDDENKYDSLPQKKGADSLTEIPVLKATTSENKKITSNISKDTDDVLDIDLGLEVKKASSKKDIISKIMGEPKKEETISSFADIFQNSSLKKDNFTTTSSSNNPNTKISTENIVQNINPTVTSINPVLNATAVGVSSSQNLNIYAPTASRESRRGKPTTSNLLDPLGLFDTTKTSSNINENPTSKLGILRESPKKTKSAETAESNEQKTKSVNVMPDWLVGSEKKSEKSVTAQKSLDETKIGPDEAYTKNIKTENIMPPNSLDTLLAQQKMSTTHMELQNASLALQQQESQLMIALQLKKYEENLSTMQKSQQDILAKQEAQFNTLLEKQFVKQQLIETNLRSTQERINNHIQLLLTQSSPIAVKENENEQRINSLMNETIEENRKFYDDIIKSLKQKHHEEIFLIEESYKKQLNLLEANNESTELRLKTEIDNITKFYNKKISEISEEKEDITNKYNQKIQKLNEECRMEIMNMKENHQRIVDDVRIEYKSIIEDFKQSKQNETSLIGEAGSYTKKLNESVEVMYDNNKKIDELQTKLQSEHTVITELKTETLNVKDRELKLMSDSLEKQRKMLENERSQLMGLVQILESRLVEQTQVAREERWSLQQAAATFTARSQALEKENELMNNNFAREREQLEAAKIEFLAEKEKILVELQEKKLEIAAEKTRIETKYKLNQNYDLNKSRSEVEAALQVARDAAELADKERENLYREQREIEMLKRSLMTKEQKLLAKEQDVEHRIREANKKYEEGEKQLMRAKLTEEAFSEKYNEMKKQMISLASREKKLSEDKISLSKERINLHNSMNEMKKCALCKSNIYAENRDFMISENFAEQDISRNYRDADLELLRLKREVENDSIISGQSNVIHDAED